MSTSKGFGIDSEKLYDCTKSTFNEGQSSGREILRNENRGHKRQKEEDSYAEFELTKIKKPSPSLQLASDDDDDPPPPSPLDKGYGKRLTGNKPHKRKTGQSSGIYICYYNYFFIYADVARKRKQNEDQHDSSTSKRFKIPSNNDITETGTTIEQESSSSHNASMCPYSACYLPSLPHSIQVILFNTIPENFNNELMLNLLLNYLCRSPRQETTNE